MRGKRSATRNAVRTTTSSDRPLGGHLPLKGKALKVQRTQSVEVSTAAREPLAFAPDDGCVSYRDEL